MARDASSAPRLDAEPTTVTGRYTPPPLRLLSGGVQEAALARPGQRGGLVLLRERAVYQPVVAVDLAPAGELDQPDLAGLAGLPADRRTGQDVEVHPERRRPVEAQPAVDLEEVEVRADVDGPDRSVRDLDGDRAPPDVGTDRLLADQHLARHDPLSHPSLPAPRPYRIGLWIVSSFEPSGNSASTWMNGIISGTPSITSARSSSRPPSSSTSPYGRPALASSSTSSQ